MKRLCLFFCIFLNFLAADVEEKLDFALKKLPEWNPDTAKIKKVLGGATNHNYIVKYRDEKGSKHRYVIRIESQNRQLASSAVVNEITCHRIAADSGLAPKIILALPEEGIIVIQFIRTSKKGLNINDPGTLQKCLSLIRSIHRLPGPFPQSANPFDLIDEFAKRAASLGCVFDQRWQEIVKPALQEMKRDYYGSCLSVPCHLDLSSENLLDDGERIWAIDWEFSANSDPLFDLGTLASVSFFNSGEMKEMLELYGLGDEFFPKFYAMTILADIRWYLWSLVQMETSELDYPYEEWAENFLQKALEKIINSQTSHVLLQS